MCRSANERCGMAGETERPRGRDCDDDRQCADDLPQARGGRKLLIAPEGATRTPPRARIDNTMGRVLALAFHWRRMLETGHFGTIKEIAAAE